MRRRRCLRNAGCKPFLPLGAQSLSHPLVVFLTGGERVFFPKLKGAAMQQSWVQWRAGVVDVIRCEFRDVLDRVDEDRKSVV